jgi:hypothetical protein
MTSRPMLLMFTQGGCPACEAAIPEWEKFKGRNPMQLSLQFDADGPYAEHFGLKKIRATPIYVLRAGEQGVVHEGVLKAEALEKWVKNSIGELA